MDGDVSAARCALQRAKLCRWRTSIGEEVDFVIELGGKPLPIEVMPAARPRLTSDCVTNRDYRRGDRLRETGAAPARSRLYDLTASSSRPTSLSSCA